jgi:arsenite transporter
MRLNLALEIQVHTPARHDSPERQIARSVLIFLGIPLAAGYFSRRLGERRKGRDWYESRFLPRVGPFALHGLLFTIVILFALQGQAIISHPLDVTRIALPLLVYFALMWAGAYALGKTVGLSYERTTTLAFTAAGNNFKLAIAVAIGTFGVTSGQALAGVVGPLIEVLVLVAWSRCPSSSVAILGPQPARHAVLPCSRRTDR